MRLNSVTKAYFKIKKKPLKKLSGISATVGASLRSPIPSSPLSGF
jgi:hypothetical protein